MESRKSNSVGRCTEQDCKMEAREASTVQNTFFTFIASLLCLSFARLVLYQSKIVTLHQGIIEARKGDSRRRLTADIFRGMMDGEARIANSTELSIWIIPFPGRHMDQ